MKLRAKFTLLFLACGLAPLLLGLIFVYTVARRALDETTREARQALEDDARRQMTGLLLAKKSQMQQYFDSLRIELLSSSRGYSVLQDVSELASAARSVADETEASASPDVNRRAALANWYAATFVPAYAARNEAPAPAMDAYVSALSENAVGLQYRYLVAGEAAAPVEGVQSRYGRLHAHAHAYWDSLQRWLRYHNIYIIDGPTGQIVYSYRKTADFGASLREGPMAQSHLAAVFRRAMQAAEPETVVFADFEPYLPSLGERTCFAATALYEDEERRGVVVFQLDLDDVRSIIGAPSGLGKTGEVFLAGSDFWLRSQASGDGGEALDNQIVRDIFSERNQPDLQQRDVETRVYENFLGQETLVGHTNLSVFGAPWTLIAKTAAEEAFAAVNIMDARARQVSGRMIFLSNMLLLVVALFISGVLLIFTKPIIRPLRSTVAMLRDMAQGEADLNRRIAVETKDEVGELAMWFNTFMSKLQGLYRSLENEVAERKRAQEYVEKSQQYFRSLIENASDVIVIVGDDMHPLYVSPSFERTFGYSAAQFVEKQPLQFVHEEDRGKLLEAIKGANADPGKPHTIEVRMSHEQQGWRSVEAIVTSRLDDSAVHGVVLNLRDITARKEAEKILREYNDRLEREVAERTQELTRKHEDLERALEDLKTTQDQLVLNEKMASLGALTAGIAHEIKNPLNFINNFSDLTAEMAAELAEELSPCVQSLAPEKRDEIMTLLEDVQQNAEKISEHGRRADSIVKNMLLHSRGMPDAQKEIDLNAMLEEYLNLTFHGIRAQDATFNVTFERDYAEKLPKVEAVPQNIGRVLLNLLSNACYAVHERAKKEGREYKPTVRVATEATSGHVAVHVRDNGPGIPEEVQARVFTPFFTTKPSGEGTGLGLSISYDIVVQEHKGELRFASEPGKFTEFTMMLPRKGE